MLLDKCYRILPAGERDFPARLDMSDGAASTMSVILLFRSDETDQEGGTFRCGIDQHVERPLYAAYQKTVTRELHCSRNVIVIQDKKRRSQSTCHCEPPRLGEAAWQSQTQSDI
jgi:hypothetical protein